MQTRKMSSSFAGWPLRIAAATSLIWIPLAMGASAQEPSREADRPVTAAATVIPQQVRYSGKLAARAGDTVEAEFRIYAAQEGGDPLWTETQQVPVDRDGSYAVQLGAASPAGLPQALFAGGAARWLGISVDRSPEQERVLLSSVPYAMKSADAESLAGHAAAEFVTREQLAKLAAPAPQAALAAQPETSGMAAPTGSGTSGTVPLWTDASTLGNSVITQEGTSEVGINYPAPTVTLEVGGQENLHGELNLLPLNTATTAEGSSSQALQLNSSSWSTTASGPVDQTYRMLVESTGNDTASPEGLFWLQYYNGGAYNNLVSINSNGVIGFAPTQTFPGTVTSVSATGPVTASTALGAVSVGLDQSALVTAIAPAVATAIEPTLQTNFDGVYAQLDAANTFTGKQSISGNISLTPATLATTSAGVNSPMLEIGASSWWTNTSAARAQTFGWQAQVADNDTSTPTANLDLMFASGGSTPAKTGLSIAANGNITFASGQTFPGTGSGTIAGITTTSPLTGSGTSGSVALGINQSALVTDIAPAITTAIEPALKTSFDGVYAQLDAANKLTGNQSISGNVSLTPASQATSSAGVNSPLLEIGASAYSSGSISARAQNFAWQARFADNNTINPKGVLALLFGSGAGKPVATGLSIAQDGNITFAPSQTFPGTGSGTIAGITTSSPLTGSGTSGSVALGLNTSELETTLNSVYSRLTGSNSFSGLETFTGFSAGILSTATSVGGTAIYAAAGASGGTGVSSTGAAYGVVGSSNGAGGIGVEGAGNYGVEAIGQAYGVYATAASSGSSGVWGQGAQYGVYGNGGKFGLYGFTNSGPGTAGVYGVGSVGVQGGGTTYGVQGGSAASTGIGVYGSSSGSNGVGVQGSGAVGVQGNGAVGVQGSTTIAGGSGVYGTGTGSGGYGVYGNGGQFGLYGVTNQAPGTAGVYGIGSVGLQGSGTVYGVQGNSATPGGFGVAGQANQYGIYGVALGGGNASGVYGTAPRFGLYGAATGGNNTVGVYGQGGYGMQAGGTQFGIQAQVQNGSAAIAGVDGIYGEPSASGNHSSVEICYFECGEDFHLDAIIQFQAGVWADTNYDGDDNALYRPALMATADANIAGVLVNNSNIVPVLFVYNAGSGGGSTGTVIRAQGRGGSCSFTGNGDTSCSGTLKSTVKATTAEGPGRVETYAVQSTENWFEDAGSAQLVNGAAQVSLEPIFGQTVNTGIEYHVFLTPNGDCKGLYVTNKTASGFEVHELGGGRSSIPFEYRLMAKRLGHEKERLVRVVSPRAKGRVNSASAALDPPK